MTKKFYCPHHEESTPSAVAYHDHYFSFCCGRRGPLTDLGLAPGERIKPTYVENLQSTIELIRALPKKEIRGFQLHYDNRGYYLVWPDSSYYKRRIEGASSGDKYRGPSGHQKPWLQTQVKGYPTLALVEGEFNALSYAELRPEIDVISPGGAGDFYSRLGKKYLESLLHYNNYFVIVDDDAAGLQAAIETKAYLASLGRDAVKVILVKEDFNDVHCKQGIEQLREYAIGLGLPGGLRRV